MTFPHGDQGFLPVFLVDAQTLGLTESLVQEPERQTLPREEKAALDSIPIETHCPRSPAHHSLGESSQAALRTALWGQIGVRPSAQN